MSSPDLNRFLVSAIAEAGADTVFGIPGGGNNLDFIEAAEIAGLRFVLAHAETPAAMMAAVYADLTDTPAACVATRGPGAASVVNGVACAVLDRQQLVLVTDAVATAQSERIAHQRIDQRRLFAAVTKWSATVGTGDVEGTARHAVAQAMEHPRVPVHLNVDPSGASTPTAVTAPPAAPDADKLDRLATLLGSARKPVVLLGGGARAVVEPVRALVQHSPAPVLMTYRAKGVVPDSWSTVAGLLTGATSEGPLLEGADLVVMIGVDTVDLIPSTWSYAASVVSVTSGADTARYVAPEVEIVGDLEKLVAYLATHWFTTDWDQNAGRAHLEQERARLLAAGPAETDDLAPQELVQRVRAAAPAGAIASVDAGAHMLPSMCLWETQDWDEVLISSGLATMGFAVPAAIGAALARPGRRVVCFTGDGGLGMSLGELETIRRLCLPITVVVFNDAGLSLIALKARPEGNGVPNAVEYADTDFAAVARGYGLAGFRVATAEALDAALADAFAQDGPTLVDVRVDPTGYPRWSPPSAGGADGANTTMASSTAATGPRTSSGASVHELGVCRHEVVQGRLQVLAERARREVL